MADFQRSSLAFILTAISNDPHMIGTWNLVWRYIINIPTHLVTENFKALQGEMPLVPEWNSR